jgi:hypothetical protein
MNSNFGRNYSMEYEQHYQSRECYQNALNVTHLVMILCISCTISTGSLLHPPFRSVFFDVDANQFGTLYARSRQLLDPLQPSSESFVQLATEFHTSSSEFWHDWRPKRYSFRRDVTSRRYLFFSFLYKLIASAVDALWSP